MFNEVRNDELIDFWKVVVVFVIDVNFFELMFYGYFIFDEFGDLINCFNIVVKCLNLFFFN